MNNVVSSISQIDLTPILTIICLLLLIGLGLTIFFLINKNTDLRELRTAFDKIMTSFDELDEQAKLIVKTDLELNKAQEELDRRLAGLNTLQKLSRRMSMTLDENEIFQRIDPALVSELGFSRAFAGTYDEDGKLIPRSSIGFESKKVESLAKELGADQSFLNALKNGLTFSSLGSSQKTRAFITHLFDTEHFILAPMLTQRGVAGIIFFGNRYNAAAVTEGDEELVGILAGQLAQSLENSQLFEQTYRSSQMLETKVNERTKELSHALKTVEDISKKKSEFISAVSHELRTPLTSIKGYASILMTGKVGDIPEAVKERLGKINLHSDNLVKLINDLLDISRIESGRVEMKTSPQKMRPIADNIADLLTPQLQNKGVALRVNIAQDLPEIEVDSSQVERVFINLVGNAIKFTPPGGSITINGHINRDRNESIFEVADTGIGITKEDLSKIFDEFYRVDNEINLNVKGTGLGLALAKNIVEAHYGKMWVTSEVGAGTTFHFTIPVKHEPRETKKTKLPNIEP
jgi:signal transduction histidine kinase